MYDTLSLLISYFCLQVSNLAEKLSQPPYSLPTVALSIDDLYVPHDLQLQLAAAHPLNPLVQHRGHPSTHDLSLLLSLFSDLRNGRETRIPTYDKSAYNGQGDRMPTERWRSFNKLGEKQIQLVILEGWCVGFRALKQFELKSKWEAAVKHRDNGDYQGRLAYNRLEDVEYVNRALVYVDSAKCISICTRP